MTFKISVNGTDRTTQIIDNGFTVTQSEMGMRRTNIRLYEQLYTLGDELKIEVNGVLKFQGEIDKEMVRPGEFTVYASDLLITLADDTARSNGHYEYTSQEYSSILKDLLSYYFSGVFDVTNVDDTGMTCDHINLKGKQISECIKILAQRSKHVFWLEPPNFLYFKEKGAVSSGYSAIYGTNIDDISIVRDTFTKTKILIKMKLGTVEVGTGTRIAIFFDDTITTEDEAEDVANAILEEMQDVQIRGEITLTECRHDLVPGTTIQLEAPQFGFNGESIRIKSVSYTPYKTRIIVGTLTSMVESKLISFEDRIRHIENRGLTWVYSCESRTQSAAGCSSECEINCQVACEAIATCHADCQTDACQSTCQLQEQISCIQEEQICGTGGVCQAACQAGHGCESACQSQCQAACQSQCQNACQESCQGACEAACQGICETTCQTACLVSCMTTCETTCQTGCETTCQTACLAACQTTCETTCQETCETSCMVGCEQQLLCCGTIGPL